MATEVKLLSSLSKSEQSAIAQAKAAMSARFLGRPPGMKRPGVGLRAAAAAASVAAHNVVGVGIDEKYVDGVPTGVHSIKFLVRTKVQPSALSTSEKLPPSVDGIPTDVEEVGMIVPLATKAARAKAPAATTMPNPKTKIRPAQPGCSTGFRDPTNTFIMAGTFGLVVKDTLNNIYVLSNNHVLADENGVEADGVTTRRALSPGAPVFQPGLLDGGKVATDQIAELTRWIDLRADQTDNKVDGAIAKALQPALVSRNILFIGPPTGTTVATKDMIVQKFGRTTSYRAGRVSSVFFDVSIPYEVGEVMFSDQIAIRGLNGKRFSDSGDSGSAILERSSNKVVGLLFAGATNANLTFGNHIADVLSQLKVQLV